MVLFPILWLILPEITLQLICSFNFTEDKPEVKDLRSHPPNKVKLPPLRPAPPLAKGKPNKVLPT